VPGASIEQHVEFAVRALEGQRRVVAKLAADQDLFVI